MTDTAICDPIDINGVANNTNGSRTEDQSLPIKPLTRPSGIPRLFSSSSSQKPNNSISEERNIKTRIPVSPNKTTCQRPKSIGSYVKCSGQDTHLRGLMISPSYSKRTSRDVFTFSNSANTEPRHRMTAQSLNRYDRAVSEENQGRKSIESSYSELTNNSRSPGGTSYAITSKIGSLANARHKPGGGNVKIFEDKVDFSSVESRCGSKSNMKHKPGGGDIEIVNRKLEFSKTAEAKVNSLKNIKHQPLGGDVKIDNRKLEWNTNSKVGSLNNVKHKPGGGTVQIVNQQLPWLKYNKPNLPPEEIAKINKRSVTENSKDIVSSPPQSYSNSQCSELS